MKPAYLHWILALPVLLVPGSGPALAQEGSTATGTSNAFNPAISLNSLFLSRWQDPSTDLDGFQVQEVELALTSVVDPYFKASAYIAYEPATDGPESEVSLEEIYAITTALPAGLAIRAGRFFIPYGRHNQLHTHAFPFIDAPLSVRSILAPESVGDVAVEADYSPVIPWFMNLRLYAGDGAVEGVFDGESQSLAAGARVDNLWDLSDASTLEGGLSVWGGPGEDRSRILYGADLRLKYRDPRKVHGHIVEWLSELMLDSDSQGDPWGFYSLVRYRMLRRWWLGAGYSIYSKAYENGRGRVPENEVRAQIAFAPSEFSALRTELVWRDPVDGPRELAVEVQFNVTIGSHPAHAY